MKLRTRKRRVMALQMKSSRLGAWGQWQRFIGGAKWARRQRACLGRGTVAPLEFNTIRYIGPETPFERTYHATPDPNVVRVVDVYRV